MIDWDNHISALSIEVQIQKRILWFMSLFHTFYSYTSLTGLNFIMQSRFNPPSTQLSDVKSLI